MGDLLLSGDRDGNIFTYNTVLSMVSQISIQDHAVNQLSFGVNAMAYDDGVLFVGTRGSDIMKMHVDLQDGQVDKTKVVIRGHYGPCKKDTNEVWGLAVCNQSNKYFSCSDDGSLRLWNVETREMETLVNLNLDENGEELPPNPETKELNMRAKARSVAVSPDDSTIAVGFRDGSFRVYKKDLGEFKMFTKLKKWI